MVVGLDHIRPQLAEVRERRPVFARTSAVSLLAPPRFLDSIQQMQYRYRFLFVCLATIACGDRALDKVDSAHADSIARASQDSVNRTLPGYIVDSIRPVEEELRRFRAAVGGDSATVLAGGATSRAELVRQFIEAVATADTIKLRRMMLTPREFSDIVYPESPYTRSPYQQAPGLVWSQIETSGTTGLTRLLRRLGGQSLRYISHKCSDEPEIQGSSRIWKGCTIQMRSPTGEAGSGRLFGSIVEREGHFKFINYANDF